MTRPQYNSEFDELLAEEEADLLNSKHSTEAEAHTPDPTEYHDMSSDKMVLSRGTVGSRIGGGPAGMGATTIPRSTKKGGSMGFDSHSPGKVNIIDLSTKKKVCLDFSELTPEEVNAAYDDELSSDHGTSALITFHRLAKKKKQEATDYDENDSSGEGVLSPAVVTYDDEDRHFGGGYVVPKSTKGGSQLQTSAAKPRGFKKLSAQSATTAGGPARSISKLEANTSQGLPTGTHTSRREQPQDYYRPAQVEDPSFVVHFELLGVYEMTSSYHEVVVEDSFLVLVYDNDHKGPRFRPQPSEQELFVHVENSRKIYKCFVPGIQYTSGKSEVSKGREHVVLLIDSEVDDYPGG